MRLGHQFRISAYAYLSQLQEVTWDAIPRQHADLAWQYCMGEADELIAADPSTVWVSKTSPPGMPVVKSLQPSMLLPVRQLGLRFLKRQQALPVSLATTVFPKPSRAPAATSSSSSSVKRESDEKGPVPVKATPTPPWRSPKAKASKEDSASLPPGRGQQRPPEPSRPPAPVRAEEADDRAFDLAAQGWATPGNSGNPEPPALLFRGADGTGDIWLGGLPKDASWLRERGITLLLSAMGKTAAQAGGTSGAQLLQHAVPVSHHGQARGNAWKDAKQFILPTLRAGESVYIHCLAGVHRAPVLAALMLAWVSRRAFDDCYRQVEQLRAVDPAGVRERRGGADIFKWAASGAAEDVPQRIPRPPFTWVCSRKRGSLWHIRKGDAPWCQWRQLARSFKGEVYFADSVEEALGYQRSICKMCKAVLPASMQLRAGN